MGAEPTHLVKRHIVGWIAGVAWLVWWIVMWAYVYTYCPRTYKVKLTQLSNAPKELDSVRAMVLMASG
jgi:hypothetical protein